MFVHVYGVCGVPAVSCFSAPPLLRREIIPAFSENRNKPCKYNIWGTISVF